MKKRIAAASFVLGLLMAWNSDALAAKGTPGPPNGGEEGAGNRLSFPAITFSAAAPPINAYWSVPPLPVDPDNPLPGDAVLGIDYSYGCDKKEESGVFSYPNTSCVDDLMNPTEYYTATECMTEGPCQGLTVYPIYWQKVEENNWSADQDNYAATPQASVAYVDWGDALEAVSWTERSIIRVETQPYASQIDGFDPTLSTCEDAAADPASDCKVGFQMWHVSGQGITEHWGVRADANAVSYNYDSPFQIINTGTAHLNLAKMGTGSAVCPSPGGGEDEGEGTTLAINSAPGTFVWDDVAKEWTGGDVTPVCTWYDAPYSVELSVGGKYVYGYNWRMLNVELASECEVVTDENGDVVPWSKTGWWRLTFYTTDDAVLFDNPDAPVTAPPTILAEPRDLASFVYNTALTSVGEPAESDVLYTPVVDPVNNLTYLDICIVPKTQGGGGGGGGKGKPENSLGSGNSGSGPRGPRR